MNIENHTLNSHETLLISASEAAKLLGIGRSLFYSLKSEGKLPEPKRLGGRVLWQKTELEEWIAANCPTQQHWEEIKSQY